MDARSTPRGPSAKLAVAVLAALACTLGPAAAPAQTADTDEEPPRRLGLGLVSELDSDDLSADAASTAFRLGLADEPSPADTADDTEHAFDLEISAEPERSPILTIDLAMDLEDGSWLFAGRRPLDPLERHVAAETAAVIPGDRGRGLLLGLDALELVSAFKEWRRARCELRLPDGARVARDRVLDLLLRDRGQMPPSHLSVVPYAAGWVGEAIHAPCAAGRCRVEGLPAASGSLLVQGAGAALLPWNPADRELYAILRPTGTVVLVPDAGAYCEPLPMRLVALGSGLPVPVPGWIDAGRGPWFQLPAGGLPLVLPEGSYWIETPQGRQQVFEVRPGPSSVVSVSSCPGSNG